MVQSTHKSIINDKRRYEESTRITQENEAEHDDGDSDTSIAIDDYTYFDCVDDEMLCVFGFACKPNERGDQRTELDRTNERAQRVDRLST